MSIVTNVILHAPLGTEDSVGYLNRWLEQQEHHPLIEVSQHAIWGKAMECLVYMGAFNHFPVGEFVAAARQMVAARTDHYPLLFQLFVMEQDEEVFTDRLPVEPAR